MVTKVTRPMGTWDINDAKLNFKLNFGTNTVTELPDDYTLIPQPYRDIIRKEVEDGKIIEYIEPEPDMEPEEKPIYINETCPLGVDANRPCQYSKDGSCPDPCIHDQTGVEPLVDPEEKDETVPETKPADAPSPKEPVHHDFDEELLTKLLNTSVKNLDDALDPITDIIFLKELKSIETRVTALEVIDMRIGELTEADEEE